MSTDWFLYSPSHNREVMVGSNGLSGPRFWPDDSVREFMIWAIEENVNDIVLMNEHYLLAYKEKEGKLDEE